MSLMKIGLVLFFLVSGAVTGYAQGVDISANMMRVDSESYRYLVKIYAVQNSDKPRESTTATGSGELVRGENGVVRILTNAHVVGQASTVMVQFVRERYAQEVAVLGVDPVVDLALLEAPRPLPQSARPIALSRKPVRIGEVVYADGYPSGSRNLTFGFVTSQSSALAQSGIDIMFTHQAPIMPGSSGGSVVRFTDSGALELVGINTMVYGRGGVFANVSLSIKSSVIEMMMSKLENERSVAHAYAGLVLSDIEKANPYMVRSATGSYPPTRSGVIATDVPAGTPANRAGIQPGDVISKFEVHTEGQWFDLPFETASQLAENIFFNVPPGTRVRFTTNRGAQDIGRELVLEAYPLPKKEQPQ